MWFWQWPQNSPTFLTTRVNVYKPVEMFTFVWQAASHCSATLVAHELRQRCETKPLCQGCACIPLATNEVDHCGRRFGRWLKGIQERRRGEKERSLSAARRWLLKLIDRRGSVKQMMMRPQQNAASWEQPEELRGACLTFLSKVAAFFTCSLFSSSRTDAFR